MSETQQTPATGDGQALEAGRSGAEPQDAGMALMGSGGSQPDGGLEAGAVEATAGGSTGPVVAEGESGPGGDDQARELARDRIGDPAGDEKDPEPKDGPGDEEGQSTREGDPALAGSGARRGRAGPENLRRLEEEGEVAADYLEELLDIVDLDGDIDIDVENGRASVAIVAEASGERQLRRLVGQHGEVLEALQELSRLAVQARTGDRSRLMLDVAGFRAARRRTLESLAERTCREVRRTGSAVRLDPMTAFERKVVHDVVAGAGLVSESEGEDPDRRVVVHPAGA